MISIDTEKCTACGHCVAECPSFVLQMQDNIPVMISEKGCIGCGHCVSVCPESAFDHSRNPLIHQPLIPAGQLWDEETTEVFLRSRRSVRNFKTATVEREKIRKIMDIARFAPSGGNSQSVSYLAVDDKNTLAQISSLVRKWLGEAVNPDGSQRFRFYKIYVERYMSIGIDVILRDAPVLVVALAPQKMVEGFSNARFSLAYAELYAPTLGLASCWAGFFEMCGLDNYEPLNSLLGIPPEKAIRGGIIMGYPKYHYHRLVDRNPLDLKFF